MKKYVVAALSSIILLGGCCKLESGMCIKTGEYEGEELVVNEASVLFLKEEGTTYFRFEFEDNTNYFFLTPPEEDIEDATFKYAVLTNENKMEEVDISSLTDVNAYSLSIDKYIYMTIVKNYKPDGRIRSTWYRIQPVYYTDDYGFGIDLTYLGIEGNYSSILESWRITFLTGSVEQIVYPKGYKAYGRISLELDYQYRYQFRNWCETKLYLRNASSHEMSEVNLTDYQKLLTNENKDIYEHYLYASITLNEDYYGEDSIYFFVKK